MSQQQQPSSSASPPTFFAGCRILVVEPGLGQKRADLFRRQINANGGTLVTNWRHDVTHVVTDLAPDPLQRVLGTADLPATVHVVEGTWVSECLKHRELVDDANFRVPFGSKAKLVQERALAHADDPAADGPAAKRARRSSPAGDGEADDDEDDEDHGGGAGGGGQAAGDVGSADMYADADSAEGAVAAGGATPPPLGSISTASAAPWEHSASTAAPWEDAGAASTAAAGSPQRGSPTRGTATQEPSQYLASFATAGDYVPARWSDTEDDSDDDGDAGGAAFDPEADFALRFVEQSLQKPVKGKFVCMGPCETGTPNLNAHLTTKLEGLLEYYKNRRDQWRQKSYTQAISALKRHTKKITTRAEAEQVQGVGKSIADKIEEILESGELQKAKYLTETEEARTINLFANIWGAGPKTASTWWEMGLRTLADVRDRGSPTPQQLIGIKYYDEFRQRMPRSEVEQIETIVRREALAVRPGVFVVTTGSYRRGKETCGDIDIILTHPDGASHRGLLPLLVKRLQACGLVTENLTLVSDHSHSKYMGVCLIRGSKHRRLDILVGPYSEWPFLLLHFTGSGYLNRSMRLIAQKKGMHLSQHGLFVGVHRAGNKRVNDGTPVPGIKTEEDIFRALGLKYLEPHERNAD